MLDFLRFDGTDTAKHALNGGITGGKKVTSQFGRVLGLHGKTLVFNTPSGTVTFDDPTGVGLTALEIQTQIQDVVALAGLTAQVYSGYLRVIETIPSAGVVLDATGTANVDFGFSSAADAMGVVYGAWDAASPPRVLQVFPNPQLDGITALVEV